MCVCFLKDFKSSSQRYANLYIRSGLNDLFELPDFLEGSSSESPTLVVTPK